MLKQGCHLFGWQPNTADWQPALPPPDKHGDSSGNQQLMHVCDLKKRTKKVAHSHTYGLSSDVPGGNTSGGSRDG
jgi:hypothetical protein